MNSSSEEDNRLGDQNNSDADAGGSRRCYKCVFCKRGFNTAQALGGHMNIHRKERAKNRPVSVNSDKSEEIYDGSGGIYSQIRSSPSGFSEVPVPAPVSYRTYIPASTSVAEPSYARHNNGFCDRNTQGFNPVGDHDWRQSLSLQFGPPHKEDKDQKIEFRSKEEEEEELDLELRLGHNP
ncbi:hypothetical protein U1Q18_045985 [Sarracenia purpurea var. burkii]